MKCYLSLVIVLGFIWAARGMDRGWRKPLTDPSKKNIVQSSKISVEEMKKQFIIICMSHYKVTKDKCIEASNALIIAIEKGAQPLVKIYFKTFLNAMGFATLPGDSAAGREPPQYSVFYTKYSNRDVIIGVPGLLDLLAAKYPEFGSSRNIKPGHFMDKHDTTGGLNDLLGKDKTELYWQVLSEWMAVNTKGDFALWVTGATDKGRYFPNPGYFGRYELPNLSVSKLIILIFPKPEIAKQYPDMCKNDKESYDDLKEINKDIVYTCCTLDTDNQKAVEFIHDGDFKSCDTFGKKQKKEGL